ncbi:hypothetical protein LCGC14_2894800 [marine sediment metagenome]|uniref:Uncharacterized protein n=1 Tax=marine sediment metagenome TaxID=412755 RepID=A0A0F9AM99_9ZZZZ
METGSGQINFFRMLEKQGIDTALWIGSKETIREGLELTPFQQIGVHLLARNENGFRYLTEGMAITEKDIKLVKAKLTEEQLAIADWLDWQYRTQWGVIRAIAVEAGIDPKKLERELNYSPIIRIGLAEGGDVDFVSLLVEQFNTDSLDPEQGFLQKRKKRAMGKIELDASIIYMMNVKRTETFKAMAPIAKDLGRILANPSFKNALNNATNGHGAKIMNTWLRDTIRGFMLGPQTLHGDMIAVMRRNGIIYAIGYNLPSSFRQTLSGSNAMAVDPLMRKYLPVNVAVSMKWGAFKEMQDFVDSKTKTIN